MFRRARTLWCLTIVTAGLIAVQASAQELQPPVLEVLLRRGGDYVQDFVAQFANVVAEEQYLQTWKSFRRTVVSELPNEPLVVTKLFDVIAPKYADRTSGYTRLVHIGQRKGDAAEIVQIELV